MQHHVQWLDNGQKKLHLTSFWANAVLVKSLCPEKNISTKFSCESNFFLTRQILKWDTSFSHQWLSYNFHEGNLCWTQVPFSTRNLLKKLYPFFVFETLSCVSLISKDLHALLGFNLFLLRNITFTHLVGLKNLCSKVCIEWRNQEEI